ncbi:tetratricopeptide repeat protein [Hyalangium versicolor]|uniref:tetratricopeptide repeat protein n=1 Tax=Hyalangium versicolor TaxID=2861190 RepID=UPI001CCBF703|nr:tetratricopeptide repeat protein [Hyalangium versicolor]
MSDAPFQRWSEQPPSSDPVEAEAARLARTMPPAEALSPEVSARVLSKMGTLPPPLPLGGGLLKVLSWLGVASVLVAGSVLSLHLKGPMEPPPSARVEPDSSPALVAESTPPALEAPPVPASPPPAPPASPEVAPEPAPAPAPGPREPRPANALLEEAKLLGRAVEQLRREQDPKAALETLRRYFKRYPRGELSGEAEVTRVEALLRDGRKAEALRQLERLYGSGFEGLPRPAELALQRAELLADARRHAEAMQAFSEVLSGHPAPALEERALFGRAVCRARGGDEAGMRADLEAYLQRFPDGRFAQEARERLSAGGP